MPCTSLSGASWLKNSLLSTGTRGILVFQLRQHQREEIGSAERRGVDAGGAA